MPVYKQTYHHYTGQRLPRSLSWLVITQNGIKQFWKTKWSRLLLLFCLMNFFVFAGRLYLAANEELMQLLGMNRNVHFARMFTLDNAIYYQFLTFQFFSCYLITVIVGADLIAADRRTRAIALYLSKPITRLDYLFGKGGIVVFYLWLVSLIPAWTLMGLEALFRDDWLLLLQNGPLALDIFLYANTIVLPMTLLILALSSLAGGRWLAAVMFSVIYFLPGILNEVVGEMVRHLPAWESWLDTWGRLLNLQTLWMDLGAGLFPTAESNPSLHWLWPWIIIFVLCGLCMWVLSRRIRPVEIVK